MKNIKTIIGTWSLSGDYGHVDITQVCETLNSAYELGFREFDTAPSYGNGFMEFCLGNLFFNKPDVRINTKMGNIPFEGKSFKISLLKKSFDQSLIRLKRKKINILYLHNPRSDVENYSELFNFLNNLKSDGFINKIGLSMAVDFNYGNKIDLSKFDVIQNDVNLLNLSMLKTKYVKDIILTSRSPLASGMLTEKFLNIQSFPSDDHRSQWLYGDKLALMKKKVKILKEVSSLDLTSLSLKFLFQEKKLDHIICGIKNKSHLANILKIDRLPDLTTSQINLIYNLYETNYGFNNEF